METKLTPRHIWIQNRIDQVLHELSEARQVNDVEDYMKILLDFSNELNYLLLEWCKYYPRGNDK